MSEPQSADPPTAADSGPTESAADVRFTYQRTRSVDREGRYGAIMRWIGEHPFSAGLAGGVGVVAIASAAAPQGIATAPLQAGLLSLMVIAIWAVLFYFVRDFFLEQSRRETSDSYTVEADAERFRLEEEGRALASIDDPVYELRLPPGVDPDPNRPGAATLVWLVVRPSDFEDDGETQFVLETKITAEEASQYAMLEGVDEADETLPIHLASGLLQLADRAG